MEARRRENRILGIIIGLLIFVLIACGVLFYYFFNYRVSAVNDLNSKLTSLQANASQASTLRHLVDITKSQREKLNMYFITRSTIGSFIEELDTFASHANISMTLNAPSVEKDKQISQDKFLRFNLRAEGEFRHVFHFLELIESMPYKVIISTVNIGKLDPSSPKSQWFLELTVNLISYTDK